MTKCGRGTPAGKWRALLTRDRALRMKKPGRAD